MEQRCIDHEIACSASIVVEMNVDVLLLGANITDVLLLSMACITLHALVAHHYHLLLLLCLGLVLRRHHNDDWLFCVVIDLLMLLITFLY